MSTLNELVKTLRADMTDDTGYSDAQQAALAVAIASLLPVPALPPTTGTGVNYYNINYATTVRRMISDINDAFMIDVVKVSNLILTVYEKRYNIVHRPLQVLDLIAVLSRTEDVEGAVTLNANELNRFIIALEPFYRESTETIQ